jgi:hypothetical protein
MVIGKIPVTLDRYAIAALEQLVVAADLGHATVSVNTMTGWLQSVIMS